MLKVEIKNKPLTNLTSATQAGIEKLMNANILEQATSVLSHIQKLTKQETKKAVSKTLLPNAQSSTPTDPKSTSKKMQKNIRAPNQRPPWCRPQKPTLGQVQKEHQKIPRTPKGSVHQQQKQKNTVHLPKK